MRTLLATATVLWAAFPLAAADPVLIPGKYLLAYHPRPLLEQRQVIVEIKEADGKLAVSLVDGGRGETAVSGLAVKDRTVSFGIELGGGQIKLTFEGTVDPKNPKQALGSLGDDTRTFAASLTATDAEKLTPRGPVDLPDEMKEAQKVSSAAFALRVKARQTKDADEKKKLLAEADEAAKKADAELPELYKKVVAAHPGTPSAAAAASELLDRSAKLNPTVEEAKSWADAVVRYSAQYGSRIERTARIRVAEELIGSEKLGKAALPFADSIASDMAAPLGLRVRALKVKLIVERSSGAADAVAKLQKDIDAMELVLDKEYMAKVPPFKPTKYAGRKDAKANRVAVLELFTGAQCPPCVAADVAADALLTAYKSTELVVLQYHMHIPGPDPLTNSASIARYGYYQEKFPMKVRGTPSTVFNGKADAGGGGGMANSEKKFDEYRDLINEALESQATVTLDGSAKKDGDAVTATVSLIAAEGKKLASTVRVKMLLTEGNVRYTGGNGVRFHHHVVRAVIGDADGFKVGGKDRDTFTGTLNLAELRKKTTAYLDEFAKETPFPFPDRPLDLKGLKVVALVQDDDSGEVLQAIELPVVGSGK